MANRRTLFDRLEEASGIVPGTAGAETPPTKSLPQSGFVAPEYKGPRPWRERDKNLAPESKDKGSKPL
jgi:hypothetical protein